VGLVALAAFALSLAAWSAGALAQDPARLNGNLPPGKPLIDLQDGFETLGEKVGPSVVVISTMKRVGGGPEDPSVTDKLPDSEYERLFGRKKPKSAPKGDDEEGGGRRGGIAQSAGSGVIISSDGYILTNHHVVEDANEIEVSMSNRRRYMARVVGSDQRSDLAVIKVEASGLPAARLGDAEKLKLGHWAIAMGNPFGIVHDGKASLSVGVISGLGRYLGSGVGGEGRYYGNLVQTDAAVNPGNSGGPLLNVYGEVIGINTVISTRSGGSEGVGFAVPINAQTKELIAALKRGEEIAYGYLGAQVKTPTEKECVDAGTEIGYGAIIGRVEPGAPADKGGLKQGDLVVSFAGQKVLDSDHMVRIVGGTRVGQRAEVIIHRGRDRMVLSVEVAKREMTTARAPARVDNEDWRGLVVRDMTLADRARLNLPLGRAGVVIERMRPDSPAARAGSDKGKLSAGDLVTKVGTTPVRNLSDFRNAVKGLKGAAVLFVEGKPAIAVGEE
jgi:serine protease Do